MIVDRLLSSARSVPLHPPPDLVSRVLQELERAPETPKSIPALPLAFTSMAFAILFSLVLTDFWLWHKAPQTPPPLFEPASSLEWEPPIP